jgi:fumarylacetoacetase
LLPYLQDADLSAYDLNLEVSIKTPTMGDSWDVISKSNMKHLYYSVAQTIAHHTVTGCNLSAGDMLGSGTISSTEKTGYGSMVELCWGGKEVIKLANGEERKFLVDGDEINLTAHAKSPNGFTIGFGDCRGKILPSKPDSEFF